MHQMQALLDAAHPAPDGSSPADKGRTPATGPAFRRHGAIIAPLDLLWQGVNSRKRGYLPKSVQQSVQQSARECLTVPIVNRLS